MKKRYEINMTKGPLLPELLQFILPLMLSSMLQIAFNAADLIVVGRFGRPHSMAAVGANGAMINLIINVLMGLATAAACSAHGITARTRPTSCTAPCPQRSSPA